MSVKNVELYWFLNSYCTQHHIYMLINKLKLQNIVNKIFYIKIKHIFNLSIFKLNLIKDTKIKLHFFLKYFIIFTHIYNNKIYVKKTINRIINWPSFCILLELVFSILLFWAHFEQFCYVGQVTQILNIIFYSLRILIDLPAWPR